MDRIVSSSFVLLAALASAAPVCAQDMNIAVSRLGRPNDVLVTDTNGNGMYDAGDGDVFDDRDRSGSFNPCVGGGGVCQDDEDWERVMTQFAGAMIPPVLTPAGTRGVRGIYVGFETWLTPIDNDPGSATGNAWFRAVEGDGMGTTERSRFVDSMLVWGRFNVRKGLPFGFELGTSVGYLANTTYWTLGLEIRWALFEGFREEVGWIPDLAVRGAVQTLIGDGEFNVTVPSVDIILSEPFVVANSIEITPSLMGQLAWVFADSELVDLNPGTGAFDTCSPDPVTPPAGEPPPPGTSPRPPYCRGDGSELNYNVVFPSLRSFRARGGVGLQIRFEWFTVLGSFLFDFLPPGELDGTLPADIPRQWQLDLGVGLTL